MHIIGVEIFFNCRLFISVLNCKGAISRLPNNLHNIGNMSICEVNCHLLKFLLHYDDLWGIQLKHKLTVKLSYSEWRTAFRDFSLNWIILFSQPIGVEELSSHISSIWARTWDCTKIEAWKHTKYHKTFSTRKLSTSRNTKTEHN